MTLKELQIMRDTLINRYVESPRSESYLKCLLIKIFTIEENIQDFKKATENTQVGNYTL